MIIATLCGDVAGKAKTARVAYLETHPWAKRGPGLEMWRYRNRHVEAELHFRRALAICDSLLPGDHPQTIQTLVNYARLLRQAGRKGEASRMEKRAAQALASRKKTDPSEGLTVDYRDVAR